MIRSSPRNQENFDLGEAPVEEQAKTTSTPASKCWSFLVIQTAVGGTENRRKIRPRYVFVFISFIFLKQIWLLLNGYQTFFLRVYQSDWLNDPLHSGKLYVVRVGKNLKTILKTKNIYAGSIYTLMRSSIQIFTWICRKMWYLERNLEWSTFLRKSPIDRVFEPGLVKPT